MSDRDTNTLSFASPGITRLSDLHVVAISGNDDALKISGHVLMLTGENSVDGGGENALDVNNSGVLTLGRFSTLRLSGSKECAVVVKGRSLLSTDQTASIVVEPNGARYDVEVDGFSDQSRKSSSVSGNIIRADGGPVVVAFGRWKKPDIWTPHKINWLATIGLHVFNIAKDLARFVMRIPAGVKGPFALALVLFVAGCAITPRPLNGGRLASKVGGDSVEVIAPENPQTETTQTTKKVTTRKFAKAPASARNSTATVAESATVEESPIQPAPQLEEETVTQEVTVQIGASQKDTSREMAAKLAALRPTQFFGMALIVAALAMLHPVVRIAAGGGKELQMWIGAAGVALIFIPQIISGNETRIILGVIAALAVIFLQSRLSYKKGIIDANKNGIPDDEETPTK